MKKNRLAILAVVLVAAIVGGYTFFGQDSASGVEVTVPALTPAGTRGEAAFGTFCADCHGTKAQGTEKGPPLIHKIYHPGHHGDASIVSAVLNGARAHHWPYGDMKPVEGITEAEIVDIIAFVREVQFANGIY